MKVVELEPPVCDFCGCYNEDDDQPCPALDACDIVEQTIIHSWNDTASTTAGHRAFYPTWGPNSNGPANIVNDRIWQDTGDRGGYGGPVMMALIDAGEFTDRTISPRDTKGGLWRKGVERLRHLGGPSRLQERPD